MAKAPLTVNQFCEALQRSELMKNEDIEKAITDLAADRDAECESFAKQLEEKKIITPWQKSHLMSGRFKGFFLGQYKLMLMLGAGGMGAVYLAQHVMMQRLVAVKVLYVAKVDKTNFERFVRESQAVAALDHQNIVRAFHFDNVDEYFFLVMEFIDGPDLQLLVERHGPLPYAEAAHYIIQAAAGLGNAHEHDMVHRDIKPANLLRDPKRVIKLLDLGVARMTTAPSNLGLTLSGGQSMIGTVDYLSPEQAIDAATVDARADIYSLGCTLYFLLTGHPPFPDGTPPQRLLAHQIQPPPPIYKDREDAPEALVAICERMMAKTVEDRFQNTTEVSLELNYWLNQYMQSTGLKEVPCTGADITRDNEVIAGSDTKVKTGKAEPPTK